MTTKNRSNPFDPALPAKETFVGRETLLRELVHGLRAGKSYELTGPVKIGKTDLLRQIQRRINEDAARRKMSPLLVPVHIECSRRIERVESLFVEITTAFTQCLVEQCECQLPLKVHRDAVAAAESGTPGSLGKALDVGVDGVRNETKQSVRAVFLLDALHRITEKEVLKKLLGALNNEVDRKHINVLLAGRHLLLNSVNRFPESVSNLSMLISGQHVLGPLNKSETKALIAVAERLGWPVAAEIEDMVYQFTAGNPYRVQYYLHASLEQHGEITPKSLLGVHTQSTEEYLDKLLTETTDALVHADGLVTHGKVTAQTLAGSEKRKSQRSLLGSKLGTLGSARTGGTVESIMPNESKDLVDFLASVSPFFMSRHIVAGKYVRYATNDVQHLKSEAVRLMDACTITSRDRENFFVWGHPGEGKTFFVSQVAKQSGVRYVEININDSNAVPDEKTLSGLLSSTREDKQCVLCALDEIDKRPDASKWLYSSIFTFLDSNIRKPRAESPNKVFVLIGSKQPDFAAFQEEIRKRDAGKDLLRRVVHREITIPRLNVGDRMVTALSMIWASRPESNKIVAVSSLALAYLLAANPTNGAIADATKKALGNTKNHETSFTADHLQLKLEAWEVFHERYPSAKSALFKAFVQMHS